MLFVVQLSLGESIWSPRWYDYSMSVAPEGREGVFTAMASAPLFLGKFVTGAHSATLAWSVSSAAYERSMQQRHPGPMIIECSGKHYRNQDPFSACWCEPVNGYKCTLWGPVMAHKQAYSLVSWTLLIASHCLLWAVHGLTCPHAPLPDSCQANHECLSLWGCASTLHAAQPSSDLISQASDCALWLVSLASDLVSRLS